MKAQIIKKIADSILKTDPVKHSNKELSKIHSNASLRRLIEGLVQNYFQENKYVLDRYVLPSHKSPITRVPRTITHDNSKFKTLNSVQSLPYLYPSPLI